MFSEQNIFQHLAELRTRLMYIIGFFFIAFIGSYFFAEEIYRFLTQPLVDLVANDRRLIFTGITEVFFTYIKLALFAAFILTFPVIATQAYLFLAPGLYKNEKLFLIPFLLASPILFLVGAGIVYYYIMPLAWEFFLSFESPDNAELPIQMELKVSEYLSPVLQLIVGFGIALQLPIILLILAKLKVIDSAFLRKRRKYALVIILIAAAVLTPPDIISQIGLAVILYGLYELSIIGSKVISK